MLGSLKKSIIAGSALAAALLFAAPTAHAAVFTFNVSQGSGASAVSAQAVITTSAGSIQVVLTNTLSPSQLISSAQALSDISFTTSNSVGTVGAATASGQLGTFTGTGPVTYVAGSPDRWLGVGGGSYTASGTNVSLEALGGGQPNQMILPTVSNGGSYPNVNQGFANFVPYTIGPATFTLALSGITAATTISNVTFSFGTAPEFIVTSGGGGGAGGGGGSGQNVVPEPATLTLLGLGMLGTAYRARRRTK